MGKREVIPRASACVTFGFFVSRVFRGLGYGDVDVVVSPFVSLSKRSALAGAR